MAEPSQLSSANPRDEAQPSGCVSGPTSCECFQSQGSPNSRVGLLIDFEDRLFSFLMLAVPFSFWVLSFFSNSRITSRGKIDLFGHGAECTRTYAHEAERHVVATPHIGYVTREEYETQFSDVFRPDRLCG
jgi:hypothetical protein